MKKKVVLAYSGGLDTTAIIAWLKETYDYEIIAACINVGQGKELVGMEEKALASGASKIYIEDQTQQFLEECAWPTLKAGAIYESKYMLGTSIARPVISKRLVEIAQMEGAEAICHGCTGKGNDQVRFELTIKALAPDMKIIAPWRIWDMQSREDVIEYCEKKGLTLPWKKEESYSRDRNIWHLSHEGLELEDPSLEPDYKKLLKMTTSLEEAPNTPEYVTIGYKKGIPVSINGEILSTVALMEKANEIAGKHGVGLADIVESRIVGMKSRGVYETPGGTLLYTGHQELEHLCLDKQTYSYKQVLGIKFAELVYSGEWYTPLRQALSAFVDSTQEMVTGTVTLKLYKGNVIPAGAESIYSLYNEDIASFATGDLYDHKDAAGFINLFGLPMKVRAMMLDQVNKGKDE
ncbi:argininosuccinate synthase [Gottschalkiaceae bacterium SANA]|nr:argininosuccinate synthase [Gottschalkiaceae bacterium SANA]